MELNDGDYILGTWFAEQMGFGNFIATVKRGKDGKWEGEYRFRYYVDDKQFDSQDKKRFYRFTADCSEEKMLELMREVFEFVKPMYPNGPYDEMIVQGSADKFMELAQDRPWFNISKEKKK